MMKQNELDVLSSELREDFRRSYKALGRQISEQRLESLARWSAKIIKVNEESFLANVKGEPRRKLAPEAALQPKCQL